MSYGISIDPANLDKLIEKFDGASRAAENLQKTVRGVNSEVRDSGQVTLGGRDVSHVPNIDSFDTTLRRRSLSTGSSDRVFQWAGGANQRLDKAESALKNAIDSGDQRMIDDAKANLERARRGVERQEKLLSGQTRDDFIMDALMSSRIGPGGRLLPLVNKLQKAGLATSEDLEAFGLSAANAARLAPVVSAAAAAAIPIAIATVGAGAIYALATKASEVVGRGTAMYYGPGGSYREIGQAMAVGANAQTITQFSDELRRGSIGANILRGSGIQDFGPFTADKTGNFIKALDAIRGMNDAQRRQVFRDMPSLNEFQWTADMSPADWEQLKNSMGPMGSPDQRRAAANLRGQQQQLGNAWERFATGPAGRLAMREVTSQVEDWNRVANTVLNGDFWLAWPGSRRSSRWQLRAFGTYDHNKYKSLEDARRDLFPEDYGEGGGRLAPGQQPRTLYKDGYPVRAFGDEPYGAGGGSRFRGSVPAGAAWQWQDDSFTSESMRLGAF